VTDSQNSDKTAASGRELYHLQFSLQAASPEIFEYTIVCFNQQHILREEGGDGTCVLAVLSHDHLTSQYSSCFYSSIQTGSGTLSHIHAHTQTTVFCMSSKANRQKQYELLWV
jgi:hypothetical protein